MPLEMSLPASAFSSGRRGAAGSAGCGESVVVEGGIVVVVATTVVGVGEAVDGVVVAVPAVGRDGGAAGVDPSDRGEVAGVAGAPAVVGAGGAPGTIGPSSSHAASTSTAASAAA